MINCNLVSVSKVYLIYCCLLLFWSQFNSSKWVHRSRNLRHSNYLLLFNLWLALIVCYAVRLNRAFYFTNSFRLNLGTDFDLKYTLILFLVIWNLSITLFYPSRQMFCKFKLHITRWQIVVLIIIIFIGSTFFSFHFVGKRYLLKRI
jgi:hypothetical protein